MAKDFSISIPIGSWHPLLTHCLQSLECQADLVEIAVLDASNDSRVRNLLNKYDTMFAYRRTGPDKGQSDAIIEGWDHTTAPILGWLNADDALYPNALSSVIQKFKTDPTNDVVYGDSIIIDDNFSFQGYHWAVAPPSATILSECIISQPSCFFRRKAVDEIGGLDRNLHYTMDWDLWVRLWRNRAKFDFLEETLSKVLWSRNAKTGGFNIARRTELDRIISQNTSVIRKAKSRIGFALHHTFEYMTPKLIAKKFRQLNAGKARLINGMDRTGRIFNCASLHLAHYGDKPATGIIIDFSDGASGNVVIDHNVYEYSGGINEFKFNTKVQPSEVITIEITATANTALERCWLCP